MEEQHDTSLLRAALRSLVGLKNLRQTYKDDASYSEQLLCLIRQIYDRCYKLRKYLKQQEAQL
jgi:hypothetical protein